MRRAYSEVLLSAGALGLVLAVLVATNDRVREQVTRYTSPRASAELVDAGARARATAVVALRTVKEESLAHAPLTVFVVAASVLTLFMVRT
jgi:hypothetical protein